MRKVVDSELGFVADVPCRISEAKVSNFLTNLVFFHDVLAFIVEYANDDKEKKKKNLNEGSSCHIWWFSGRFVV